MLDYDEQMSEAAGHLQATDPVEARLRDALNQGDSVLVTVAPLLRHLLASDDSGLFGDAILARVRGMTADVARQLLDRMGSTQPDRDVTALTAAMLDQPAFLSHAHALVIEWQLTEALQARLSLDPVLSPLLQALIGASEEMTAGIAMKVLAAQARFGQAQRRMRLPLTELPGDLLHTALLAMRGVAGAQPEADARAAAAEAAVRADYDEGRTRIGLIARLVGGMGGAAVAALSVQHAGVAIFLSALAIASGQDRDVAALATTETQRARLALALCAAIDPDAVLPAELDRLKPERAAALLAAGGA
jgi:hypothetical protein